MSERGRRLCLLCEAGPTRFAIPASSVLEVATPDSSGAALRGHHLLTDLSQLFGGAAEQRPGTAVLLDTSPTLALRVKAVRGARDVAGCPFLPVPRRLAPQLEPAIWGLIELDGELFFELDAEELARRPPLSEERRAPVRLLPASKQVLVFETGGKRVGLPVAQVAQVLAKTSAFCPLPAAGACVGVMLHRQEAWPIYCLPALRDEPRVEEPLLVLARRGEEPIGFTASRALGVLEGPALEGVATLELADMFS